jgi:hypothetical protein
MGLNDATWLVHMADYELDEGGLELLLLVLLRWYVDSTELVLPSGDHRAL